MRVKVWSRGRADPLLRRAVADRAPLRARRGGARAVRAPAARTPSSATSAEPENRYERPEGKLLEAYTPIRTPDGTPVLFEIYQRFSSVQRERRRACCARSRRRCSPACSCCCCSRSARLVAGAAAAARPPRARGAARERGRGVRPRSAGGSPPTCTTASSRTCGRRVRPRAAGRRGRAPRRRRARPASCAPRPAGCARACATCGRCSSRSTRRTSRRRAWRPRSSDLLSPLEAAGIATELHVDAARARRPTDALVYRVAREALRNVHAHAGAHAVRVDVTRPTPASDAAGRAPTTGAGSTPPSASGREAEGHVGLTLLAGPRRSAPAGTLTVRLRARRRDDRRPGGAGADDPRAASPTTTA